MEPLRVRLFHLDRSLEQAQARLHQWLDQRFGDLKLRVSTLTHTFNTQLDNGGTVTSDAPRDEDDEPPVKLVKDCASLVNHRRRGSCAHKNPPVDHDQSGPSRVGAKRKRAQQKKKSNNNNKPTVGSKRSKQNLVGDTSGHDDDQVEAAEDGQEEEEQVSGGSKYKVIVKSIKCLQPGCGAQLATRPLLYAHLADLHDLLPYGCVVTGCGARFASTVEVATHSQNEHAHIREWLCAQCPRSATKYKSHKTLGQHIRQYHEEGEYECGYAGCHFVATNRQVVENHVRKHFACNFVCKWPRGCQGKSFKHREDALRHVRKVHLKLSETLKAQQAQNIVDDRDPADYIEEKK